MGVSDYGMYIIMLD